MSMQPQVPDVATLASRTPPQERKPMRIAFFLALTLDLAAWVFFVSGWLQEDLYTLAAAVLVAFFLAACGALVSILGLIAAAFGARNREERLGYSLIALATSVGSLVLFVATIETAASILD